MTATSPAPYPWEVPTVPASLGGTAPSPAWVDPTLRDSKPPTPRPRRPRKCKVSQAEPSPQEYLASLAVNADVALSLVMYRLDGASPALEALQAARDTLVGLYDPRAKQS